MLLFHFYSFSHLMNSMNSLKQLLPSFLIGTLIGGTATLLALQTTQPLSPQGNSDFTTQGVQGGGARKDIELTFGDGTTKTLGEVHTNQYLLLDIADSSCGQCIVWAEKHNDLLQKRSNEGNCQLLTVTKDGDLPSWIGKIWAAPFVQSWSAYVVWGLYKLMAALNIQWTVLPYYALVDSNGQIVKEQMGWPDLEKNFAPYCGQPKEGLYCDIDEDSFISKDGISIDPKDVPHVEKVQVGTETKYIYCDAQSCKYVSCDETTPGNDCNDTDKGITIPGTACTSPEGYPGVLDDTCTCQTNLWFCDGDLDGHKSKTPYSTDPNVVPHIKETQVGTETKFILCDANECHYVDCLHTPGDDCDDTDKNKGDCEEGEMISVGGQVTTMDGAFLGNVIISVYHTSFNIKRVMTDNTGVYKHTSLPKGQSLVIRPEKRDWIHLDFVSVEDLLLLEKYLNGQKILTAEQMIAADVNNDNRIDQTDVQLIRDLILGKISHFPVQSIWEFTLKNPGSVPGVTFNQTTQKASTKWFAYSIFNLDFNAIKLGDISGAGGNNDGTTNGGWWNGGGTSPNTCKNVVPVKWRSGSPDGKSINYPGGIWYDSSIDHSCTQDGWPYCDGVKWVCYPTGAKCYYFCQDSKGVENYTTSCAQGDATNISQPQNCPAQMQDKLAGCGTYCTEENNGGGANGGAWDAGICGPAHGKTFSDAGGVNAAGLCIGGVAVPNVVAGNGPWDWTCLGTLGAGNAYCRAEANKGTKGGLCWPAHGQSFSDVNGVNQAGLCAQGTAVPSAVSGPAPWHRSCRGDLESSLCEATQKAWGVIWGSVDTLQRDIGNWAQ